MVAGRATGVAAAAAVAATAIGYATPGVTTSTRLRRRAFPRLAGVGDPGRVALTFDDGPAAVSTPHIAQVLARHGVHATFFLLGCMVVRSPALARTLVEAGHEVAVHGWTHRGLLATGPRVTHTGLSRTRSLICAVTGQTPRFFRPAYGILTTPALLAAYRLDLTPVLWTNWGRDWEPAATPDSVLRTVSAGLRGGATVLLHDGNPGQAWRSTLGALPGLLDYCAHRGWAVGPLRDHFHPTVP